MILWQSQSPWPAALGPFVPPVLQDELHGARMARTVHEGSAMVWRAWGPEDAPCVVLLHGGSGSWLHWVRNIRPLLDLGHQVLVPDLPGKGESDLPPGCTDATHLPPHLHAGLAQLLGQPARVPVRVVGFSFGALTAALWLRAHPEAAERLVLVGAPSMGLGDPKREPLKGWRHLLQPALIEAAHRHNLMALMLHRPEGLDDWTLALHAWQVGHDRLTRRRMAGSTLLRDTLPDLKGRVDVIYGQYDALYMSRLPEVREAMAQALPRMGQWIQIEGAGHWVQYEDAPAFNQALADLLAD